MRGVAEAVERDSGFVHAGCLRRIMAAKKHFNRFTQLAGERFSVREKSDRLTESLSEAEKKADLIKTGCQLACKRLHGTYQGSGSTLEKHQKKIPQYSLGNGMIDAGRNLGPTVLGNVMRLVGQGELDISLQIADYEQCLEESVTAPLNQLIEEEMKKIDKSKKKLSSARVDMDSIRNRYQSLQDKFSPKAEAVKSELDQAITNFEQCQDAYATNLFAFLSREREIAYMVHKLVVLQITRHQQALAILQGIMPHIDGELDKTKHRPVYGLDLKEHLEITKRKYSFVIEECCNALREKWMDTEGLFRLAASAAKLKLLKNSFDAGSVDLTSHDPHTIAGALKQYLRELPNPILTTELYQEWITAAGTEGEQERMQNLWVVKEKLPEENKENLRYLMHFLNEFSTYHKETKMNTNNIAIVIGPNLLWPKEEMSTGGLVGDTGFHTRIAECFVKHPEYFFGKPPTGSAPPKPVKFTATPSPGKQSSSTSLTNDLPGEEEQEEEQEDVDFEAPTRPLSAHSEDSVNGSINTQHDGSNSDGRPTPPVRRTRSRPHNEPTTPTGGSPRTPSSRPSRPAPQPPAVRPRTRPRPPSPPSRDSKPSLENKEETIL